MGYKPPQKGQMYGKFVKEDKELDEDKKQWEQERLEENEKTFERRKVEGKEESKLFDIIRKLRRQKILGEK